MALLDQTEAEQEYLKAIDRLMRKDGVRRVGTVVLAKHMGVSAASVSSMIKKLATEGLVEHSPRHGVRLTKSGERVALELLRHHRLLKTYLCAKLGMPWHEVHAEADRLEHALSEALEDRLDAALGHPTTDPHGAPIPTKEGVLNEPLTTCLWTTQVSERVTVAEVEDDDVLLLAHLAELGLVPGASVDVLARGPFGGPLHVRVRDREHALGERVAAAVRVFSVHGEVLSRAADHGAVAPRESR